MTLGNVTQRLKKERLLGIATERQVVVVAARGTIDSRKGAKAQR